ncbi:glycoside hydrolase family 16 protein [Xylaria palmicola]|nr:glycoside hydrolase family 16 protein [Xylaria palmicola]
MSYSLLTHYAGQGLLDSFSFFTGKDPANGFVDYQSRETALANNLVSIDEFNRVKLGVDSTNTYSTSDNGRPSVRINSHDTFTHGLFIADFAHMPGSTCGTWPAFWAFNNEGNGSRWLTGGEIDIIEGANTAQRNLFSAHTGTGSQAPSKGFIGTQKPADCSSSPDYAVGCNHIEPLSDSTTYGDAFNAEGGGIYALEWNSKEIKMWYFPRTATPDNIRLAPVTTPDPSIWGPPQAHFGGSGCEADSYFFNMSLAISTNFCGDYAGNIWGVADQCNELAPTCEEYVAHNPNSFSNAFWQINYIDVYQRPVPANSSSPSPVPSSTNTVTPTRTRTVTVSTVTQAISTAEPTPTDAGLASPAVIDGWTRLGCFGSAADYKSFFQVASFARMDNAACVASCVGHKYAGISGETCYCADTLGGATTVGNGLCDVPCPGNPRERCGGLLAASGNSSTGFIGAGVARANATSPHAATSPGASSLRVDPLLPRAAPSAALLTVYGDVKDDVPPRAPAKDGRPSAGGPSAVVASAVTVTYTTICPTDAGRLVTLEYRTTVRAGGPCAATPAVPMTTYGAACDACGRHGESTVTLTVPAAVAAGTGGGRVVAVAVQTVVPVPVPAYNASAASVGSAHLSTSVVLPAVGTGTSARSRTAGFLRTLGCGVALWFVIFWIGIVL